LLSVLSLNLLLEKEKKERKKRRKKKKEKKEVFSLEPCACFAFRN